MCSVLSPPQKQKEEIEQRVAEKLSELQAQTLAEQQEKRARALELKQQQEDLRRQLRQKQREKDRVIFEATLRSRMAQQSHFIRTTTTPALFYLPAVHNASTTAALTRSTAALEADVERRVHAFVAAQPQPASSSRVGVCLRV